MRHGLTSHPTGRQATYKYTGILHVYRHPEGIQASYRYAGILQVCKHLAGLIQDANYCWVFGNSPMGQIWPNGPMGHGTHSGAIGPHPILHVYRQPTSIQASQAYRHPKHIQASYRYTGILQVCRHPAGIIQMLTIARYLEIHQ